MQLSREKLMPYIIDWDGNTISSSSKEALWSNKGGMFKPAGGKLTYFPLPLAYKSAIPVIGTFTITAQYKNRPDLIAKHLYQSEDYWWLVYWFNGILDPFKSLNVGDTILVADISSVNSLL